MAKRNLLLVDADPRSVRVLEVSLRKAGYSVTTSNSVDDALELVELTEPDMVVSDTVLEGKDGFAFVRAVRQSPNVAHIPFVFLSSDEAVESKVRGLELGADEYLTKPVYIREILTRIQLIFQRQEQEGALRTSKTHFAGSLADMGLVDLLQTIDVSRKSGVLHLRSGRRSGAIYFRDGRLLDAELGELVGEPAIYRFLIWADGEFEVDFRNIDREDRIQVPTQGILMEGMRRLDEWGRLQEQLPPMGTVFHVNHEELVQRLAEIPDEINDVLRLFDGKRTLADVVDASVDDDLATLNAVTKLYFEGFIVLGEQVPATEEESFDDGDLLVGDRRAVPRVGVNTGLSHDESDLTELSAPLTPNRPSLRVPRSLSSTPAGTGLAQEGRESAAPDHPSASPEQVPPSAASAERRSKAGSTAPSSSSIREEAPASDVPGKHGDGTSGRERGTVTKSVQDPARAGEDAETEFTRKDSNVIRFPKGGSRGGESSTGEGPAGAAAAAQRLDQQETVDDNQGARPRRNSERVPATHHAEEEGAPALSQDAAPRDVEASLDGAGEPVSEEESEEARREAMFLRADAPTDGEAPASADAVETFFSSHPPSARDPFAWLEPSTHEGEERGGHLARRITVLIVLVAALAIGGFLAYHKLWMPTPAELGDGVVELPTPGLVPSTPVVLEQEAPPEQEVPARAAVEPVAVEPASEQVEEGVAREVDAVPAATEASAEPAMVEPATAEPAIAEPAAAEATLAEPSAAEPAEPTATVPVKGDQAAYEELLAEARKKGFRRQAEAIYLKALAAKPDGNEALSGLGMLLLNRGKNKQAIERASQAVGLNPTNSEGWIVLGAAHDALGDWSAAREAYRSCSEQGKGRYVVECRRMLR